MLVLGDRHNVHIASLLVLSPVNIVCHLCFRIELNTLEDMFYELFVSDTVD